MLFLIMSEKPRSSREAPPTSAPSTSGWLINSRAFDGFTLPPYWIRTRRATVASNIAANCLRTKAWVSCACCGVAFARANGPDRFVSHDRFLHLFAGQTRQTPAQLRSQHQFGPSGLAFRQRFPHTNDRPERGGVSGQRLLRNQFVRFLLILAPFRVAKDDVAHGE